jgi:hypothetical protein
MMIQAFWMPASDANQDASRDAPFKPFKGNALPTLGQLTGSGSTRVVFWSVDSLKLQLTHDEARNARGCSITL